jgi:hypothetical protein
MFLIQVIGADHGHQIIVGGGYLRIEVVDQALECPDPGEGVGGT